MKQFEFRWLDKELYQGMPLRFSYHTDRHYKVISSEWGMALEECPIPGGRDKSFTDTLFENWLEEPAAIGAFDGGVMAGVAEGSMESWHDVFRVSNLLVQEPYRRSGLGGELLGRMIAHARTIPGCRGVILETQSCNYPAITFYRKQGFQLSRIDLREYSNEDIERGEVRLDFFLPFPANEKEG